MNQNILIVDDEYEVLSWLEDLFKYEFDIEIGVYTAVSAFEALDYLNQIKMDVVLTDICMPDMDGIALFEKIKSNWPRCKTVFLTGYRNFEDIYKIINHKDVRYILKSEDDEVIQQTVKECLIEFQQELEKEALDRKKESELEKAKEWVCKSFMDDLINGELIEQSVEEIQRRAMESEITISFQEKFLIFLLKIDYCEEKINLNKHLKIIEYLLQKNIPKDIILHMHIEENKYALLLIQSNRTQAQDWMRIFAVVQGAIEDIQIIFRKRYQKSFSAVLRSTPISCNDIQKAVIGLRQLMIGYLGGKSEVIVHEETIEIDMSEDSEKKSLSKAANLKCLLELRKRQEYFQMLSECCSGLLKSSSKHDTYAMEIYYSISVMLLQFINENRLNERIAFEIGLYKLTKVDEHESWAEAAQYLIDVSEVIYKLLGDNCSVLSDRALKRVMDYINENLEGDLSLTKLANIGGFNASYLSRLFKQVYQMNVTDYIYQKRMEYAVELLLTTNLKIQDISERTGYSSSHYFSKAFRSYRGVSPIEYRELYRK